MPAPSLAVELVSAAPAGDDRAARLESMAGQNFQFIWRSLRRLGVPLGSVDDAAQQVFEVASRRLADVEPGKERAFLFKTALLVAAEARRLAARRRDLHPDDVVETLVDPAPNPEDASDWSEKRALLEEILLAMSIEQRTVFVLFELEELTMAEIAELVDAPPGTVASRLRRAREEFHDHARRLRARLAFRGNTP